MPRRIHGTDTTSTSTTSPNIWYAPSTADSFNQGTSADEVSIEVSIDVGTTHPHLGAH